MHSSALSASWVVVALLAAGLEGSPAAEKLYATTNTPSNAEAISGPYYRGNGLSYNLELTLEPTGEYVAKWHGCLSKPGAASGKWSLAERQVTLSPAVENEMVHGRLERLELLRFEGEWLLVPEGDHSLNTYAAQGVTPASCFQRSDLAGTWKCDRDAMGEFHTLDLNKDRTFTCVSRDEAQNWYAGTWQLRRGALHLAFQQGRTKTGDALPQQGRTLTLAISSDRKLLSDGPLHLERAPAAKSSGP